MMVTEDKFMILMGEAFVECDEAFATEYCETKQAVMMATHINSKFYSLIVF